MPPKITTYICSKQQNLLWKNLSKYHNYLTKVRQTVPTNQLFIIDLRCENSMDILKQAEKLEMFKSPAKWLIYGDANQLLGLHFGLDSQVFVMNPESERTIAIYKYSSTQTDFVQDYVENYADFSIVKRTNLMGNVVTTSYVITNEDSLKHLVDYRNRHMDALSKLNYILANILMDYLNATRKFIVRKSWGYKNVTTGVFSGMAGDLHTGLADLAGTPLFITPERMEFIDYIAATTPAFMKFIFRAPPLSYVTNVFTLPFDSAVWHYSFVMVAIVVVFIYVIVAWEWREIKFRNTIVDHPTPPLRPNFFDVLMLEIGAITQQGSDVEPQSNAGRIITIFTLATLMFLYTSYSANIVALLQSTTNSIQTLEDLLHSRIKLGVEDIIYGHYYFENAKEPVRKAIYEQKVAPKGQKPNFMTAEQGIRKVQEGFFAFHVELHTGYNLISNIFQEGEKCGLKEIDYENFFEPYIGIKKRSPYKEIMKIG
ncbi:glutamate receptor-like [Zophobas morio]|uniref:glutamate receptor-like n=1 Tax=Zophobas morio TaxID=2755281 RepID=UPI003083CB7C